MVKNAPSGDKARCGAVKNRSQVLNPVTGNWTERNNDDGRFMDQKKGGEPFKGVRKEKPKMNGLTHRLVAGCVTCLFMMGQEGDLGQQTAKPLVTGMAASFFTGLPDRLEPAIHPNHRQFFHSLAFAGLLGVGFVKLRAWKPESPKGAILRKIGMVAIAAYLVHLILDATTAKSLPLIGKL